MGKFGPENMQHRFPHVTNASESIVLKLMEFITSPRSLRTCEVLELMRHTSPPELEGVQSRLGVSEAVHRGRAGAIAAPGRVLQHDLYVARPEVVVITQEYGTAKLIPRALPVVVGKGDDATGPSTHVNPWISELDLACIGARTDYRVQHSEKF